MNARSGVLWIGDHHGSVLEQPGPDVIGSIAMRLPNALRNAGALRKARRELGFGVILDTEPWRNQCRPDHLLRRSPFRMLGYDVRDLFGRNRLDIHRPLTSGQVHDYATGHLNAQLAADPTILQCPGHIHSASSGWDNDIALAESTLDLVEHRALRDPVAGDAHQRRRSVFATICVRSSQLTIAGIQMIVERYVRVPVDGYFVWAIGFEPTGLRAELMLRLVLALQENSGRPACPGGLKHLWQAALARGVAAAITGPDRGAVLFDPDQAPPTPRNPDDETEDGRQIHTYHGSVLGCFGLDERGTAARKATFERNLCACEHHAAGVSPHGRKEIAAHNQWWRLREARRACVGTAREASRDLGERLPGATAERTSVGIKTMLPVGWRRAVEPWDQAPVGWGAADGRAA